ncbi:type VI secretion system ATPase TssH [Geoalkalibacter sp.]|uniref:type VI secretion system ATPase TssH n=1 Tax=Geoalkalibacter sp. TaxID=3041440 RepID=UPI00272E665E|nr:type VI secretion system ATPase TssH [Geoalkalibacter sp.]
MDNRHLRSLLERLNAHCVTALEGAAAFAATRGHAEVGVEHLAVKLLEQGGGDFERILHHFGVDLDALWQALLAALARRPAGPAGRPLFGAGLQQLLERAWLAASLHYHSDHIRSAALLDALVSLAPTLPADTFGLLDALSLETLRRDFARISAGSPEDQQADGVPEPSALAGTSTQAGAAAASSALARFTLDLTARAAAGDIDPVLGRGREIRLMLDILARRRKNNPIVVGEPGVGKTAVVEGLALRIAAGQVPESLRKARLLALDLGLLQAGAGVKGEFEKRLKNVIDEVKASPEPIILFVDEAHTLIGAGGEAGLGDAANLFKPALARGELRTIAATTWSEYKKYFERDAALARRFQLVKVEEPGEEAAIAMLSGLRELYQKHHGILITDDAVAAAVRLSARYISGRQLPDKAIDLIDTAAARLCMAEAAVPAEIDADREHLAYLHGRLQSLAAEDAQGLPRQERLLATLEAELAATQARLRTNEQQWLAEGALIRQVRARRDALAVGGPGTAPEGGDSRRAADESLRQLRDVQGDSPMLQAEVNAEAIAAVVADWTGVPLGRMLRDELGALLRLEESLAQGVLGQDDALIAIAQSLRGSKAGLRRPEAPLGVFLLAGPSGVGKTETARVLAEQLFGGERFLVTINLSEYQEAHTVSQLKGAPPGYVGYGEGGILTEAVRRRPYAVILLDEVEKAHPDVMNLFYQVFDRGFMRDGEGREIDFKNTVILMTTNLGAEEIFALCGADGAEAGEGVAVSQPGHAALVEALRPALARHFAPALVARMQVVPYRPLTAEALQRIVALKLDDIAQRLHAAHGIELRCAPEVLDYLGARCGQPATGARFINALLEQRLLPGIARGLLGFLASGDPPDILGLELDDEGELTCVFADRVAEAEAAEEPLAVADTI